jgi:hypothetical protein
MQSMAFRGPVSKAVFVRKRDAPSYLRLALYQWTISSDCHDGYDKL